MNNTFKNEIEKDYASYCLKKIQEIDASYRCESDEECQFDYHRYKFRKISDIVREVLKPSSINIPSKYAHIVEKISKKIEKGENLVPYQSRMLKSTDYDDGLLMDWGVQHLHLGEVIESDGFIKRTKELLFIRFTKEKAFIIGVFDHKQWSTQEILEVIHKNWPSSIDYFRIKNITDISPLPDEDTIIEFRKVGINSPTKLSDGTVYFGPGGGITTAATPMNVTNDVLHLRRVFTEAFNYISENFDDVCQTLNEENKIKKITIGLSLKDNKLIYIIKELNKGVLIPGLS